MAEELIPALAQSIGPVATLLLFGNVFFIRLLWKEITETKRMVSDSLPIQQLSMANMSKEIEGLKNSIAQMERDLKDFGQLRERIAILEFAREQKE